MATRPVSHAPVPYTAPTSGDLNTILANMAAAINKKADAGGATTAYHFVGMLSPNGTTWRLTVDDAGALHTEMVPRP